jgi:Spy/CpxP family protein refolding chaperone
MAKRDDVSFLRRYQLGAPITGVMVVLIALVGISVSQAGVNTEDDSIGECEGRDSSGWAHRWHHGRRGGGLFGPKEHDPERARDHMQYAAGWMLHRMEVEDEVRDRIQARLDTAFVELSPLMGTHRENRGVWMEAMLREEVDRTALEAQRQEALASASRASEIVVTAMADVAEMLSPEQRSALLERIREHHAR